MKQKATRYAALALSMLILPACGGGGPTGPTRPSFPNILGTWTGRYSIVAVLRRTGLRGGQDCAATLILNSQTGGAFSGTLQLSSPCAEALAVNGVMDSSGRISTFALIQIVGSDSGCVYVSGERQFTGTLAGSSIALQSTNTLNCFGDLVDRNQILTATRQ